MKNQFAKMFKDESGITALETAIILIAFVVVAAIFAFTVLTTGTFLTERSKEAAYSGLQEVRGSMELKGSVVLSSVGGNVDTVIFNLANVAGGSSQDLSKVQITYRDQNNNVVLCNYVGTSHAAFGNCGAGSNGIKQFIALDLDNPSNGLPILSTGKMAKMMIKLDTTNLYIQPNLVFALEVKPQTGGVLLIERTAPAQLTDITDLH